MQFVMNLFGDDLKSIHMRESIDGKYGILTFFGSLLFFYLLNKFLKNHFPAKLSSSSDQWKWRNVYVSWIHSIISATWTLFCMIVYPELFSGLIHHINYCTYMCISFASGYFVYDFIDLYLEGKHWTLWEVTAHHVAVLSIFLYNLITKSQIGFSLIALSVEVNSVFLHWRKLLQMEKTPFNSMNYIIVKYANLASFIAFRGGPLTIITLSLFILGDQVSTIYLAALFASMFVMDVINTVLLYRLLKSDILRDVKFRTKQSAPRKKQLNDRNGNVMGGESNTN
ncbi:TLC domain-containing protein 2 [Bulinus truncatus]|nr:TLC domain-containing protein 2 [Bulinus truncatus]